MINVSSTPAVATRVPLIVDLDGTLVATDTLWETLISFLKVNPLGIVLLFWWVLRGKAYFKQQLASAAPLDVKSLPYRAECLQWLRAERQSGRSMWLATGAPASIANSVAAYLDLFDGVIASDGVNTATGSNKAMLIAKAIGSDAYDYAGNAMVDLAVWRKSLGIVVVAPNRGVISALHRRKLVVTQYFPAAPVTIKVWLTAIRAHQWVKNLLVFIPLLTSHRIFGWTGWAQAACGFVIFSLVASSTYLLNDLMDLPADRRHATKSNRPLAAGLISIPSALIAAFLLVLTAGFLSLLLPWQAALMVFGYSVMTFIYSAFLKKLLMADIVTLAIFYTARLMYGGFATRIEISIWTLAFCAFAFFSLASAKRINELAKARLAGSELLPHRAYRAQDLGALVALAAASCNIALLVLILYINSQQVQQLYRHPQFLWTMFIPLLYWFSRILLLANRGALADDPVVFATKDRATYLVLLFMAAIAVAAT